MWCRRLRDIPARLQSATATRAATRSMFALKRSDYRCRCCALGTSNVKLTLLMQVMVSLEVTGEGQRCDAVMCSRHSDLPSSPLPYLHFVYHDFPPSQTTLAAPQTNIISALPRVLSPTSDSGSSSVSPLQLLAFSVSVTVPRCSMLTARLQLLQVTFVLRLYGEIFCRDAVADEHTGRGTVRSCF